MLSMMLALAATAAAPPPNLRAQDAMLARVGFRLVSRAASLCDGTGHPAGFEIERVSQYPVRVRVEMLAAGLSVLPTVTIVVADSPAAASGLQVGDRIAAVDGVAVEPEDIARAPYSDDATAAFMTRVETAFADGIAVLRVARDGQAQTVSIAAPPGCAARFRVREQDRLTSYSNGLSIQVTTGVIGRAASDAELAAVVAHELAHNILRHPQMLKASGRRRAQVRATERAADRLSVYLLEAAGYRFAEAIRFMTAILRAGDYGILSDGTHPGWRERIATMTAERARIDGLLARGEPVRPPADLLP